MMCAWGMTAEITDGLLVCSGVRRLSISLFGKSCGDPRYHLKPENPKFE